MERLTEEQSTVLITATYVGMTLDQEQEYDERRSKITKLIPELEAFEKAQIALRWEERRAYQ